MRFVTDYSDKGTSSLEAYLRHTATILRGGAAFADAWEKAPEDFSRGGVVDPRIELRMRAMIFSAAVDNFQTYLSDLLREIFQKFPQAIVSKKIELSQLFSGGDLKQVQTVAIEENVTSLAYKGFEELDEYLQRNLNFSLAPRRLTRARLALMIEARNAIVHNRGKFSRISEARLGGKSGLAGRDAFDGHLVFAINHLNVTACDIDTRAKSKFGL